MLKHEELEEQQPQVSATYTHQESDHDLEHDSQIETMAESDSELSSVLIVEKSAELSTALRKSKRNMNLLIAASVGATASLMEAVHLMEVPEAAGILPKTFMAFAALNYCFILILPFIGLDKKRKLVSELAGSDDLRVIGAMIEGLGSNDGVNSTAGSVLIRLLPRLRRRDAAVLSPTQRKLLRSHLKDATNPLRFGRYDPTLALAAVRALAYIGSAEDLPILRKLAANQSHKPAMMQVATAAKAAEEAVLAYQAAESGTSIAWLEQKIQHNQDSQSAQHLSEEAVQIVLQKLQSATKMRRKSLVLSAVSAISAVGFASAKMSSFTAGGASSLATTAGLLMSAGVMSLFCMRGIFSIRNLSNTLIHANDLTVLGALAEAASVAELSGGSAAVALTPLLNTVRANHAELVDDAFFDHIGRAINIHTNNKTFVFAALHALEQVGDERSLASVKKLADRARKRRDWRSIAEAAQHCMEFLQLRAEQTEATTMLLRASSASEYGVDMLVRPAHGAETTSAGEMLRTSSAPVVYVESESSIISGEVDQFLSASAC